MYCERIFITTDKVAAYRTKYGYDKRGLRIGMAGDIPQPISYGYDDAMRLKTVKQGTLAPAVYGYDSGGRRLSLALPNGVETSYGYDTSDRLLSLTTKKGATVLASFGYTLDAVGNRTAIDMTLDGVKNTLQYRFDNAYRLTREVRRDAGGAVLFDQSFRYDPVGNRIRSVKDGVRTDSVFNANNQLASSITAGTETRYFYDRNGNQIRKHTPGEGTENLTYDVLNRMTEWRKTGGGGPPKIERHVYRGAEWHRTGLVADGVATAFLLDGDNVVADLQSSGTGLAVVRQYVTPFLDQNLSMTDVTSGQMYWYSSDGLGSVRTVTDAVGAVKNKSDYTAFGEAFAANTAETVKQRFGFTGREVNPSSGTMYYRYRMYEASLGIFGSRDPIGYTGGIGLYAYAGSSPISGIDPYGLDVSLQGWDLTGMSKLEMIAFALAKAGIADFLAGGTEAGANVNIGFSDLKETDPDFQKKAEWLAKMIELGLREAGATVAADHFNHWLNGKGQPKPVPQEIITNEPEYRALSKSLKEKCAQQKAGSGSAGPYMSQAQSVKLLLGSYFIHWELSVNAIGEDDVCCTAKYKVDDPYDFHTGKQASFSKKLKAAVTYKGRSLTVTVNS